MSANSEIILSGQTHPGDSTTETVTGEKFKGDGFYSRSDGVHTVQYSVISFVGTIEVQATLATNPTSSDWFTVSTATHTSTDTDTSESDGSFIKNFVGNYVWVRAHIRNWTDGTISSILLNH
jgi:hypothetical protein